MPNHVRKRHVFFCSGFDPRGPAFYKRLYLSESSKQCHVNGMKLLIESQGRASALSQSWQIVSCSDGEATHTTYEILRWDDIVRAHWEQSKTRLLLHYLQALHFYFRTGTLKALSAVSWPPIAAAMLLLLITISLAGIGVAMIAALVNLASQWSLPGCLNYVIGVTVFGLTMIGVKSLEQRINGFWLFRSMAFTVKQACCSLPELENRLNAFGKRIVECIENEEIDELLIVGHSSGSIIAISSLVRALRLSKNSPHKSSCLSLLTLGQCIPMLSLLPPAQKFRDELAFVANHSSVEWIDFTAPSDAACFALTDPVKVSGIPDYKRKPNKPKLLSARFPSLFSPASYVSKRWNWYWHHFQYLMAGEIKGDYDYFAITAGHQTLAERYQSKQSIADYFKGVAAFA